MSKKDKINDEDLKFLKKLFGKSKKTRIDLSDLNNLNGFEELNSEKSNSIEYLGQISGNFKLKHSLKKENQKLKNLNMKEFQETSMIKNLENLKRKKKIKKKELLSEVAEILPVMRENNRLLHELTQYYKSIEYSLKTLTQAPIKIKIFK